jgi:hypothetical protein
LLQSWVSTFTWSIEGVDAGQPDERVQLRAGFQLNHRRSNILVKALL